MFFFEIGKQKNYFFFFFQAEDGIRDATVTGVQTCALPISGLSNGCRSARVSRISQRHSPFTIQVGMGHASIYGAEIVRANMVSDDRDGERCDAGGRGGGGTSTDLVRAWRVRRAARRRHLRRVR